MVLVVFRDLPKSANHNEFGWEQGWIARSIAMGHGFSSPFQPLDDVPTALVAPLYPYLLAGIFRIFGLYSNASALVALGLNALISASVVVPVYSITKLAIGSAHPCRTASGKVPQQEEAWPMRLPWIAAIIWALYPYSIFYSGTYLWDHTLTGALFAWTFLVMLRLRRFGVWGWHQDHGNFAVARRAVHVGKRMRLANPNDRSRVCRGDRHYGRAVQRVLRTAGAA